MDFETAGYKMYWGPECDKLVEDYLNKGPDESTLHQYAITFNICNNEYINGKRWQNYTKRNQQMQLLRRLKSYCKANGSRIQFENFVYEASPVTGQQHLHCIIDSSYDIDCEEWSEFINLKFTTRGYTTFLAEPIYNREGWKKYLRKNDVVRLQCPEGDQDNQDSEKV